MRVGIKKLSKILLILFAMSCQACADSSDTNNSDVLRKEWGEWKIVNYVAFPVSE